MDGQCYTTNKKNSIISGETVYELKFLNDKFCLIRTYLGRSKDAEWTGTYTNSIFTFDQELKEQLELYSNPEATDEFIVKGKAGCLGNRIKELILLKSEY